MRARIYICTRVIDNERSAGTFRREFFLEEWQQEQMAPDMLDRRKKSLYLQRLGMEAVMLADAIKDLPEGTELEIFSEMEQLWGIIENWIPQWKERGWLDSKKKPVKREYRELSEVMEGYVVKDITIGRHDYSEKLEEEIKEKERRETCLKDLESLIHGRI